MHLHRFTRVASFVFFLALLIPARADAGPLVDTATPCADQTLERPFARWLDPASYTLVPRGTFAGGTGGWSLGDGASRVKDNEPWFVHGAEPAGALALSGRTVATSPAICVGLEHPTLRFFARNQGVVLDGLTVEAVFEDAGGQTRSLPIGVILGGSSWAPVLPMPVVANLLPLLPGNHTPVAFRFRTSSSVSSWRIDGVYVDPYGKG
jgi:hypothetical protein